MFDSGSAITLTSDKSIIHDFCVKTGSVSATGDFHIPVKGEGYILLSTSSKSKALRLQTYYTPAITSSDRNFTILSLRHIPAVLAIDQTQTSPIAMLKTSQGNIIPMKSYSDYRYYIDPSRLIKAASCRAQQLIISNIPQISAMSIYETPQTAPFHEKIGHMSYRFNSDKYEACFIMDDSTKLPKAGERCTSCVAGKSRQKKFIADPVYAAQGPFDVVHTDIAGPIRIPNVDANKPDQYYLAIVDEWTHFVRLCLLKDKKKETVHTEIANYIAYVWNQFGYHVRRLFSDNGSEFINNNIQYYLRSQGIIHITSTACIPASNGFIERYNLTIFNSIRTLLYQAGMPAEFWNDAVIYTEQRLNLLFNERLETSPFVFLYKYKPNLSAIHPFDCLCAWVQPHEYKKKVRPRSHYALYLRKSSNGIGSCIYDYEQKTIINTRNVIYMNEHKYPGIPNVDPTIQRQYLSPYQCLPLSDIFADIQVKDPNNDPHASEFTSSALTMSSDLLDDLISSEPPDLKGVEHTDEINPENQIPQSKPDMVEENILDVQPPPKKASISQINRRHLKMATRNSKSADATAHRLRTHRLKLPQTNSVGIEGKLTPRSYEDASNLSNFVEAIKKELMAHKLNRTWSEADFPKNKKPLRLKWVYTTKTGNLTKARLVARGDMQKEDTYEETYSPTCNGYIFRIIFSLIAQYNWDYIQMDISTAYLNASLGKDIYAYPPEGYKTKEKGKILKLNKALYGLKQSGHLWNITIDKFLASLGFQSMTYENLYGYKRKNDFVFLVLYVDDILMTGNSNSLLNEMVAKLKDQYRNKTLPGIHMMGLDILRDRDSSGHDRIILSGISHINKLGTNYAGTLFFKEINSPISLGYYFDPSNENIDEEDPYGNRPFKQVLGELNYIASNFRPEIAYATNYLAQVSKYERTSIWYQLKRVINYPSQTKNIGISFTCDHLLEPLQLRCFCDANFASNPIDRKSQDGLIFVTNGPIFWKSSRQSMLAQSSTHAEYVTLANASNYGYILLQVMKFIKTISNLKLQSDTVAYYENNQSCI